MIVPCGIQIMKNVVSCYADDPNGCYVENLEFGIVMLETWEELNSDAFDRIEALELGI